MLPEIYQVIMTNFGITKYSGDSRDEAIKVAETLGFECYVLLDGALIGEFSPIGGWKLFSNSNDLSFMEEYTYEQFSKDCDRW